MKQHATAHRNINALIEVIINPHFLTSNDMKFLDTNDDASIGYGDGELLRFIRLETVHGLNVQDHGDRNPEDDQHQE